MIDFKHAQIDTPTPGSAWRGLSDAERCARVVDTLKSEAAFAAAVIIAAATEDGQIVVNLAEPLPAGKRGQLLLDVEAHLKQKIDQGLSVWLEPLGDRNSLRNLRGIEVKSGIEVKA
jgi:hypothetical protein